MLHAPAIAQLQHRSVKRIAFGLSTAIAVALCACSEVAAADEPHPIVQGQSGYLFGMRAGGKWLEGAKTAPLLQEGTVYRMFTLTAEVGGATGGKAKSVEEPCPDTLGIELPPKPDDEVIALAASWNPMPRKPRLGDNTQDVYVRAVREFLAGRGLPEAKVKITQIVRVDLDGDGEDEVLISATDYGEQRDGIPNAARAGNYSFVLVRRVVGAKVNTQLLGGEFYPKAKVFNAPSAYTILAVLDVDGDGKMEVIVDASYYEGGEAMIFTFAGAKPRKVLSVGCGA